MTHGYGRSADVPPVAPEILERAAVPSGCREARGLEGEGGVRRALVRTQYVIRHKHAIADGTLIHMAESEGARMLSSASDEMSSAPPTHTDDAPIEQLMAAVFTKLKRRGSYSHRTPPKKQENMSLDYKWSGS